MSRPDRIPEAKAIPILEVAEKLALGPFRREGSDHVSGCPQCGGTRRFAIHPRKGIFMCRNCNPGGDGIALVQFVRGCSFAEALEFLVGEGQLDPAEIATRKKRLAEKKKEQEDYEARARAFAIRDAREIWHAAEDHDTTPAQDYLAARHCGLDPWPPTLRYLPDHPYKKMIGQRMHVLHSGPCMIAAVTNAHGRIECVHRTWIDPVRPGQKAEIRDPEGNLLKSKMTRGSKKGGVIRLTRTTNSGVIVMGEGIETTASVAAVGILPDAMFWAGVDLDNMAGLQVKVSGQRQSEIPDLSDEKAFVPPPGTKRLIYLMDGDSDPKSTRAKLTRGLRRAAHFRPGLQGQIVAADPGKDINDMLKEWLNERHDT